MVPTALVLCLRSAAWIIEQLRRGNFHEKRIENKIPINIIDSSNICQIERAAVYMFPPYADGALKIKMVPLTRWCLTEKPVKNLKLRGNGGQPECYYASLT